MIEDNLLLPPVDDGEIKTRYDQLKLTEEITREESIKLK